MSEKKRNSFLQQFSDLWMVSWLPFVTFCALFLAGYFNEWKPPIESVTARMWIWCIAVAMYTIPLLILNFRQKR